MGTTPRGLGAAVLTRHSATLSRDAQVVAFGDESGGGVAARCKDPNDAQGRGWFPDTATGVFLAKYRIPRALLSNRALASSLRPDHLNLQTQINTIG